MLLSNIARTQYVLMINLVNLFSMSYLGEDAFYNFIESMSEESKYCTDIIQKTLLTRNL